LQRNYNFPYGQVL